MTGNESITILLPIVGLLFVLLAACEIGFRLGTRARFHTREAAVSEVGDFLAPVMTLLSLLLAFSVSIAESHYATRKRLAVEEANAIGTAFLRAQFVSQPERQEIGALLQRYGEARQAFYEQSPGDAAAAENVALTKRLLADIWTRAASLGEKSPSLITTGLLIAAVNQVIDLQESQLSAFTNLIPSSIIALLVAATIVAIAMVGFRTGISGRRHALLTSLLVFLLASTLFVILDLDRSQHGFIKIRNEALSRLSWDHDARSMGAPKE